MKIYTGESISSALTSWGIPTIFNNYNVAPQLVRYSFTLKNILDLQRVKKVIPNLSALMGGKDITFCDKTENGHFELCISTKERTLIELKTLGFRMRNYKDNTILFGIDTENQPTHATLDELPHCLIAGTTGSGKSVALNSYIMELCCYNKPEHLGVVLIDLKRNEFCKFEKLPHLLVDVVYDSETAENVLSWLIYEMEQRYLIMQQQKITTCKGLFKSICVVVDELTDLIMQNENCKNLLVRLLQKARACDIHIIVATQSPRAKILDGVMLANLPTRIALTCANVRESMLVLGHKGAEHLQGKGDAILKLPNSIKETRIQIPYISDKDIQRLMGG